MCYSIKHFTLNIGFIEMVINLFISVPQRMIKTENCSGLQIFKKLNFLSEIVQFP